MLETDKYIQQLLSPRELYDDGGAGAHNAEVLEASDVRPAFFDSSCLLYRFLFAKASNYCDAAGDDDELCVHMLCVDFLNDVVGACAHFACAPVLAFDSKAKHRKVQIFEDYKGDREKKRSKKTADEERMLNLMPLVIRELKSVYCPVYKIQYFTVWGYESDDIIAAFVLGLKQHAPHGAPVYSKQVVFVTSDHDLHQLLLDGVYLADVTTGAMANAKQVAKHTGIRPDQLVASKCVGGCKSDDIPGVPGCGEKMVAEVLACGSSNVKNNRLKKAREMLQSDEGLAVLRRNFQLIQIPLLGCTPPLPPLRLSRNIWPVAGVPVDIEPVLEANGIARSDWPSFGDVTRLRPVDSIEMCERTKKG